MSHEPGITTKLHLRLIVTVPTLLSLFMLTVGFALLYGAESILPFKEPTTATLHQAGAVWILVMTFLAFVGSFTATQLISRNIRGMMAKVEALLKEDTAAGSFPEITAKNEIGALGIILDEATLTLSKYIQDSYILDSLPHALITLDRSGRIIGLNMKASRLLETDLWVAKGKNLKELIPEGIESRPFYRLIESSFDGRTMHPELLKIPIGAKAPRTFWVEISPVKSHKGLQSISISLKDQSSLVEIRNQIHRLEGLAALGSMASGIAHEVRNPLGSIKTFTELTQEDLAPEDHRRTYTREILKQVDRLNELVEDILALSRDAVIHPEEVDLKLVISESLSIAMSQFTDKAVRVSQECEPNLPKVFGDARKLARAFLNIIINSFQALRGQGEIRITACSAPGENGKRVIRIDIADNGTGIEQEHLKRIFEPFYTRKARGTGLGLAIAHNIISAHGGRIEVESEAEKGTVFHITLQEQGPARHAHVED